MRFVPNKRTALIAALALASWTPAAPVAASELTCAQIASMMCRNGGWIGLGYSSDLECRQTEAANCGTWGPGPIDPGPCNPSDAWPC
jgi:hypothetical protein